MDFGRKFLVSYFVYSIASIHFQTKSILASWGLSLNLGQTRGVLHWLYGKEYSDTYQILSSILLHWPLRPHAELLVTRDKYVLQGEKCQRQKLLPER